MSTTEILIASYIEHETERRHRHDMKCRIQTNSRSSLILECPETIETERESDLIPIRVSFQNTSLLKNDDVQLDCRGTDVDMCPNFNGKLQIEH